MRNWFLAMPELWLCAKLQPGDLTVLLERQITAGHCLFDRDCML